MSKTEYTEVPSTSFWTIALSLEDFLGISGKTFLRLSVPNLLSCVARKREKT